MFSLSSNGGRSLFLIIFCPLYSLWNYNPDNDDARGDDWNGENFSWFSNSRAPRLALPLPQDAEELDLGGRILSAVVRPYAAKTAGVPLKFEYEMATGAFQYSWAVPLSGSSPGSGDEGTTDRQQQQQHVGGPNVHTPPLAGHPQLLARETEIFVPAQLAQGRRLIVEGLREGDMYTYDAARQTLFVLPGAQSSEPGGSSHIHMHEVRVRFNPPVGGEPANDLWSDFARPVGAVLVALLASVVYIFLGRT
jgi:Glycoside hydrolase family 5 C-terminal domain